MFISATLFALFLFFGMPVVFVLGLAGASFVVLGTDVPITLVSERIFSGLNSFTIMAIPFFIFAGAVMEGGGLSRRIVDFATALIGWVTGSLYLVSVTTATALAAISGSGSADAAAVSSIMQPELKRRRYDTDFAAALIAASSSLAQIIPPSLLLVVVAAVSSQSTGALFIAGVAPGLLAAVGLLVAAYLYTRRRRTQYQSDTRSFSATYLARTFWSAIPALFMPVIIVGGIVSGVFTATEAAAVAAFYSLVIGIFVYRELRFKQLHDAILRTAILSAAVMLIIGTANIFAWLIASEGVADHLAEFLESVTNDPFVFLLILNGILLVVGMFMESIAAILILMPIFLPIAQAFGVHPIHFGVMFVFNLAIGMFTPPYGITLFVCSSIAERTVIQVARRILAPLCVMLLVLLAVSYFPEITLFLPQHYGLIK